MPTDLALDLLRHGYDALPQRRARVADPDAYLVRLAGRRALVVRGEDGAQLFYDTDRVARGGVTPAALADLLFGRGAVHGLDGREHLDRKGVFLGLLSHREVGLLGEAVAAGLDEAVDTWQQGEPVSLFDELVHVYGVAVLDWASVGVSRVEAERVSRDLASIVAGFGFRPTAYANGWRARVRANRWARTVVDEARRGQRRPRPGSAVDVLATGAGADLPRDVAAVELLNVLRPTVAVAWLGAFAALELVQHADLGERVLHDTGFRVAFAHEVRRRAPFVPALAARATTPIAHHGHVLRPGDRLVLDVPGTDHHPGSWDEPDEFRPSRFLEQPLGEFRFVPQGGGRPETGHRCPGEDVATTLLTLTLERLAATGFDVADTRVDRRRIPALPRGGLMLTVSPAGRPAAARTPVAPTH